MTTDPDDAEFDQLRWLKFEARIDVDAELATLYARRHQDAVVEDLEARLTGDRNEALGTRVLVPSRDPVERERRRKAAPLVRVDSVTRTLVWPDGHIEQAD
jgi:hypothetical protein